MSSHFCHTVLNTTLGFVTPETHWSCGLHGHFFSCTFLLKCKYYRHGLPKTRVAGKEGALQISVLFMPTSFVPNPISGNQFFRSTELTEKPEETPAWAGPAPTAAAGSGRARPGRGRLRRGLGNGWRRRVRAAEAARGREGSRGRKAESRDVPRLYPQRALAVRAAAGSHPLWEHRAPARPAPRRRAPVWSPRGERAPFGARHRVWP